MHLISVIVPVYKVEEYLRECVDSIISQTYRNLEIILVDDGSPDNCPAICDEYAEKDKRIIVIHQQNGGLSAARNAGLDIASGEFICFVDSDDVLHPQYCEILISALLKSDCSFSACLVESFQGSLSNLSFHSENYDIKTMPWKEYIKTARMGVWNKLYRAAVFEYIRFMNGKVYEDIIFCADLSQVVSENICCCDYVLYYGRIRSNSIISDQFNKFIINPDRIFAAEYLITKFKDTTPDLFGFALNHSIGQPWTFVDSIYVRFAFKKNISFLKSFSRLIKKFRHEYMSLPNISKIQKSRMRLFSRSCILYGFNAYTRLFRVYLYRIFSKDPYKNGHGI